MNELERVRQRKKERLRWRILRTLLIGGSVGVNESLLLQVVVDVGFIALPEEIRECLQYLEDKGLVEIVRRSEWVAKILALGVDVCEGNEPVPPGLLAEG
jgi:hypothetical protein